ncbi:MAG: tRNA pseudouridine(55) synthase TruB [Dehalococcoidia bacterium]|nr:tRNA pseudouridine(55) synthase TruB [Dehalococcoidia bacterium]MDW8119664.1 tRNA pseudouridine(55) synthase TruB [Chloroflexota bacterium]
MGVHGFLNLLKPSGMTSMDAVRRVKRLTRERSLGHGGTLDPLATGVLPILFGQASRLMDILIEGRKVYRGVVRLGITTDTYDVTGTVLATSDPSPITREQVEAVLARFTGTIIQVPPAYSALKQEGEPLYHKARRGEEVHPKPRRVRVYRLTLLSWTPPTCTIEIECGRGVYIRSLAHDIGQALGCGGALQALERLQAGPFRVEEAVSLDTFAQAVADGTWKALLYPPDFLVRHLKAAILGPATARMVAQGQDIVLGRRGLLLAQHGEMCRLYTLDGQFLALARYDSSKGRWHPDKVFTPALEETP